MTTFSEIWSTDVKPLASACVEETIIVRLIGLGENYKPNQEEKEYINSVSGMYKDCYGMYYISEMINCIKEHQHPTLVNKIGTIEFADFLLIALGSTQFDIQTYNIYKYYRYNYFFTYVSDKIDMKKEFYKKFNVDYNSFLELRSILSFFCSLKVNLEPQILRYIILKYSKATSLLRLSREAFQKELTKNQINFVYAEEADVLNMALFGMTAKEWRDKNPELKGNIRDYATMNELICLANLENLNSVFINEDLKQSERLEKLNKIAISQMQILNDANIKYLK